MDLKKLKNDLEAIFQSIQGHTDHGEMPLEQEVSIFVRLTVQMQNLADDEWIDECIDFTQLANQLLHAVKKGQVQDSILLVESLSDAKSFCHRTFRD